MCNRFSIWFLALTLCSLQRLQHFPSLEKSSLVFKLKLIITDADIAHIFITMMRLKIMMQVKDAGPIEVPPRLTHRPAMRVGRGTTKGVGIRLKVPLKVSTDNEETVPYCLFTSIMHGVITVYLPVPRRKVRKENNEYEPKSQIGDCHHEKASFTL